MQNNKIKLPRLRTHNLVVNELPNETLIYDLDTNKAFCFNETARLVMNQCDGTSSVDEALNIINRQLNAQMSADMIWLVVSQLKDSNFIEKDYEIPIETNRVSRRKILHAAASLGIALPIITSLVAPKAVDAQSVSCVTSGTTCIFQNNSQSNCCSSNDRCYYYDGVIPAGFYCRACFGSGNVTARCPLGTPDCCATQPTNNNICCNTPINVVGSNGVVCQCG
jgi:hypothetical protein